MISQIILPLSQVPRGLPDDPLKWVAKCKTVAMSQVAGLYCFRAFNLGSEGFSGVAEYRGV